MSKKSGKLVKVRDCTCSGPGERSRYSDSLRAGRSWDGIPLEPRFSVPFRQALGTTQLLLKGYWAYLLGVKRPGRGINHPPHSSAEVNERLGIYLYYPPEPCWPVLRWTFTFTALKRSTVKAATSRRLQIFRAMCLRWEGKNLHKISVGKWGSPRKRYVSLGGSSPLCVQSYK